MQGWPGGEGVGLRIRLDPTKAFAHERFIASKVGRGT